MEVNICDFLSTLFRNKNFISQESAILADVENKVEVRPASIVTQNNIRFMYKNRLVIKFGTWDSIKFSDTFN